MCGITGFTGYKNKKELLRLLSIIKHRGRDGQAVYIKNNVNIGMNRLAIIDLSSHLYPMRYKQFVLMFNGEIYNFPSIKKQLSQEGVCFKTKSDAEVILPLFVKHGIKSFEMLEGMFAFCIYDIKKQQIILARDKSGEKPLYFTKTAEGIIFASEIKALLSIRRIHKVINKNALRQYLTHGFVRAPDTLIETIQKVPAASCVVFSIRSKRLRLYPYWVPKHERQNSVLQNNRVTNEQTLDALIRKSVNLRMIADVPVGCFLSGGIDSSLIAQYASQIQPNIQTFSISFPNNTRVDESSYAKYVANMFHTNHTEIACTSAAVRELVDDIGTLIDEPIVDPAVLPTLLLAREARKSVKVVLTGEGADELFGGYPRYINELCKEFIYRRTHSFLIQKSIKEKILKFYPTDIFNNLQERYSPQHIWKTNELNSLLRYSDNAVNTSNYNAFIKSNPLLFMQLTDLKGFLSEQLFNKIDKSTMAFNLEARAPYMDTNIINFALHLSQEQKIHIFQGKYVLKQVAMKYFPRSFVWRPKHGFDVPLSEWFRNDLKPIVYESLRDISEYKTIISHAYYTNIINDHMEKRTDNGTKIWSMIVFSRWLKRNIIKI